MRVFPSLIRFSCSSLNRSPESCPNPHHLWKLASSQPLPLPGFYARPGILALIFTTQLPTGEFSQPSFISGVIREAESPTNARRPVPCLWLPIQPVSRRAAGGVIASIIELNPSGRRGDNCQPPLLLKWFGIDAYFTGIGKDKHDTKTLVLRASVTHFGMNQNLSRPPWLG